MNYKGVIAILGTVTASICILFGVYCDNKTKDIKYQDDKKEKLIKQFQSDGCDYYTAAKKATEILNDDYESLKKCRESTGSPSFDDISINKCGKNILKIT